MARIDRDQQRLTATLLVVGARGAGKTALLRTIRERVPPARHREGTGGRMLADPLLDWLALDLGTIGGWRVHVDMFAVAGARSYDATRRVLLADADGLLMLADSQAARLDDNATAFRNLTEQLVDREGAVRDLPRVYCWTKQDLPEELILAPDALANALNPHGAPAFATAVLRGEGVLEALHAVVTLMMRRLAPAREVPK
jgi:signal recognition particle receptor subunit beta